MYGGLEYKNLNITTFKREGNKRKVQMMFIKVGIYFKIINDVYARSIDNSYKHIIKIMDSDIPDYDKCFLISEALYLVEDCFLSTYEAYLDSRKKFVDKFGYRLDVDLILQEAERRDIKKSIRDWEYCLNKQYKHFGDNVYHTTSHTLYNVGENKYWVDGYNKNILEVINDGE